MASKLPRIAFVFASKPPCTSVKLLMPLCSNAVIALCSDSIRATDCENCAASSCKSRNPRSRATIVGSDDAKASQRATASSTLVTCASLMTGLATELLLLLHCGRSCVNDHTRQQKQAAREKQRESAREEVEGYLHSTRVDAALALIACNRLSRTAQLARNVIQSCRFQYIQCGLQTRQTRPAITHTYTHAFTLWRTVRLLGKTYFHALNLVPQRRPIDRAAYTLLQSCQAALKFVA